MKSEVLLALCKDFTPKVAIHVFLFFVFWCGSKRDVWFGICLDSFCAELMDAAEAGAKLWPLAECWRKRKPRRGLPCEFLASGPTNHLHTCVVGIGPPRQLFHSSKWLMLLLLLKKFGRLKLMNGRRRKKRRGKGRGKSLGKIGNARYEPTYPTISFPFLQVQVFSATQAAVLFCFPLHHSHLHPNKNFSPVYYKDNNNNP